MEIWVWIPAMARRDCEEAAAMPPSVFSRGVRVIAANAIANKARNRTANFAPFAKSLSARFRFTKTL